MIKVDFSIQAVFPVTAQPCIEEDILAYTSSRYLHRYRRIQKSKNLRIVCETVLESKRERGALTDNAFDQDYPSMESNEFHCVWQLLVFVCHEASFKNPHFVQRNAGHQDKAANHEEISCK